MDMTRADYEERQQRIDDGEGTDEDRRLVKHYEREQAKQDDSPEPSWLLHDDPDGDPANGYGDLSKAQLQEELGKRKGPDGNAVQYPSTANKATLISLLEANDRQQREAEQAD